MACVHIYISVMKQEDGLKLCNVAFRDSNRHKMLCDGLKEGGREGGVWHV
jgi:hypothetical protein